MTRTMHPSFVRLALCTSVLLWLLAPAAMAAPTVTYLGSQYDVTDYSPSGLDLGQLGFWFANFDTSPAETGQPIGQNAVDNLPVWAQVDNDPTSPGFSWADGPNNSTTTSTGGVAGFSTLTLPNGASGLSGQVIDSKEAGMSGQSSNILSALELTAGVPRRFILHVVVDNEDSGTASAVRRVKARLTGPGVLPDTEADTGNGLDDTRNNIADVHSFEYKGISPSQILRIQLRTANNGVDSALGSGMAGFMFDLVPEPSSTVLLLLGAVGCGCARLRRRG